MALLPPGMAFRGAARGWSSATQLRLQDWRGPLVSQELLGLGVLARPRLEVAGCRGCPEAPRHFRGRKNRCYSLAVRAVIRAFVKCTKARYLKKKNMRTLWINRITAASQEHGLKYPAFIGNLVKCQVELNRKVLADLAIYEPKTFKSLAALANRRRHEGFAAALGDGKEPEGIFSRVVQYH
ncbi:PREDICTED: 39S ribosomal protein L20, mitochondrial [Mandrillus leucophaeus]|uniref:39S ribosomal protein L20, mitochondrial n=1 Tax=Mandrillus leucophaeus TaxID=9568 RepID=UPI0005F54BA4|nr:PREDICTED: 39S ribosomal protein L20, mitochondrial [Mandrillus leucophaeus]